MLVKPFRDHHRDPLQITRISLLENLGASAIVGTLVFWSGLALFLPIPGTGPPLWGCWLWSYFLVFSVFSNLLHRWAHFPSARKPRWMAGMQKCRLILNNEAHGVHHRKPYRRNYCIASGWANGLTNVIPWGAFEKVLSYVGIPTNFD
jgi:ubiquitin-conjugating enzyme E2 variant